MGHRGGFNFGPAPAEPKRTAGVLSVDPLKFRGYSYFLDPVDDQWRTTIGKEPQIARRVLGALYSLLPLGQPEDNEEIPSGYTYLLQFVAHDLVQTTVPFWAAAEAGVPSRNMRHATLVLDTLYGGGPTACPAAFQPAGVTVDSRTELRLGKVADAATIGPASAACPYRDLARLNSEHPASPSNLQNASVVFAADERSDDNTLVSQIVVLFSIMHNSIVARLAHLGPQASFAHASTAVLTMYHAIIRNDLMEKLLDKTVYRALAQRTAKPGEPWMWKGGGVPLEFTHGAFRFGHAMVRPQYQFNTESKLDVGQMLGGPVVGKSIRDPLPSAWIVEWQRFFKMDGSKEKPNYSLKLAIHQQRPLDFMGDFQPVAADSPPHLTLRDWLSAANARTLRLDKLIEAVKDYYPELEPMSVDDIGTWLDGVIDKSPDNEDVGMVGEKTVDDPDDPSAIVKANKTLLTTDLPLPLYVMLEAQTKAGGTRLGPLGSVIVGETIFRCLTTAEVCLMDLRNDAAKAFAEDEELAKDWKRIEEITTMPQLVSLAAEWAGLSDCPRIPFTGLVNQGKPEDGR